LTVLWPKLIDEWELSPAEAESVNRREGQLCPTCMATLRSSSLALAITRSRGWRGSLDSLVMSGPRLRVLEVNRAGDLTPWLEQLSGHRLVEHPDVDLQSMPFGDRTWDLIVHSDTLEHVDDPVSALGECARMLDSGGALCFTVPIIPGRMTRRRDALPPSHHGTDEDPIYRVVTEYGADFWPQLFEADFDHVELVPLQWPDAVAVIARHRW
jgi:SAM-dependent methyltransferase